MIVTAVVGGLVLAGAGATTAVYASNAISRAEVTQQRAVDTVTDLIIDGGASSFTLVFDDVSEARLETTGTRGPWKFEREGEQLTVANPVSFFSLPLGMFFGQSDTAVLTLPRSLAGKLDASISLYAGEFRSSGTFDALEVSLGAGSVTIDGSARNLAMEVSAGRADLDLANVEEATLRSSAGQVNARLRGEAPRTIDVRATAGSVDLVVPDVPYSVRSETAAGSVTDSLQKMQGAPHQITVSVSVGSVDLRPGRE